MMSSDGIRLLLDVSSRLNSDLDIDRLLSDVLHLTVGRVEADNGSILIFDEKGQVAHKILARRGMAPEQVQTVIAEVLAQGLAGWVVAHRTGGVVIDVLSDSRWINFPDDDFVGGSAIGVPLIRRDRLVGVLTLRHRATNHFTEDQVQLLVSIADQAAVAIENARLFHTVQRERARMEAIIDGAADAILVVEQDGRVSMLNSAARQAFQIPYQANVSGQDLADLIQNPAFADLWAHRQQAGYPSTGEIPLPDGRIFHASVNNVPGIGFVIAMQDITYLKQLDRMKNDFVSAVSHDLRAPLQLILTYTSLLPDVGTLNEQQHKFIDGINRGVYKMSNLINDLLDLAKIEADVGMDQQTCHIDSVIADVTQRFETMLHEKKLALESQIVPGLPSVQANVGRIDQVLSNLLDNAIKYTPSGKITIKAAANDQYVTVHVTDTGIGLTPQEQANLFNRFYRASNEWTENIDGTGLGLVLAKSIVDRYGGRIWVTSTWQKGSTFSFSLPFDSQE
jgi:signal transduction histidine kinase